MLSLATLLGPFPSCVMSGKFLFLTVPSRKPNGKQGSLPLHPEECREDKRKDTIRQVGLLDGGRKVNCSQGGQQNSQSRWWEGRGMAGILTS